MKWVRCFRFVSEEFPHSKSTSTGCGRPCEHELQSRSGRLVQEECGVGVLGQETDRTTSGGSSPSIARATAGAFSSPMTIRRIRLAASSASGVSVTPVIPSGRSTASARWVGIEGRGPGEQRCDVAVVAHPQQAGRRSALVQRSDRRRVLDRRSLGREFAPHAVHVPGPAASSSKRFAMPKLLAMSSGGTQRSSENAISISAQSCFIPPRCG